MRNFTLRNAVAFVAWFVCLGGTTAAASELPYPPATFMCEQTSSPNFTGYEVTKTGTPAPLGSAVHVAVG